MATARTISAWSSRSAAIRRSSRCRRSTPICGANSTTRISAWSRGRKRWIRWKPISARNFSACCSWKTKKAASRIFLSCRFWTSIWPSETARHGPYLPLQIGALAFRRRENRNDRGQRIKHHQPANIEIRALDAVGAQNRAGDDRDQSAAVNLRDLVARIGARGAIAGREILRVERRDRAVAKSEHKAEADDFGDHGEEEIAGIDQVKIGNGEDQEDHGGDQQNGSAVDDVGQQSADDHEYKHETSGDQADQLGHRADVTHRFHVAGAENEIEKERAPEHRIDQRSP